MSARAAEGAGAFLGRQRSASAAPREAELERVRVELARGRTMGQALGVGAAPTSGAGGLARLAQRVRADVEGIGPVLQPLVEDPEVTDVLVGAGRTWVDRGAGLEAVDGPRWSEAEVRALAVRMAAACSRRLDDASPVVDATLPDGTRLNAVLPPLSADGTLICLRTKRRRAFTLAELVAVGTVPHGLEAVLSALVLRRASCLITGATGTGKTTLLATLLGIVPANERIVCIEEASELRPDHPHVIHLQERGANVQGVGEVPMTMLVRTALRMRPDRIVLGECRGPEVRDVLTALNTGHEGGWATLHANSPADVPARLTALGALADLDETAVAAQAVSALQAVIHLRRDAAAPVDAVRGAVSGSGPRATRRVSAIGVLERGVAGRLQCQDALVVGPGGTVCAGPGADRLAGIVGEDALLAALAGGPGEPAPHVSAAPPAPPAPSDSEAGRRERRRRA